MTSDKHERLNKLMINGVKGYAVYSEIDYLVMNMKQSEFYAWLFGFIADVYPKALRPVLKYLSYTEIDRYDNEPYYALCTADDLCSEVICVMMDDKEFVEKLNDNK